MSANGLNFDGINISPEQQPQRRPHRIPLQVYTYGQAPWWRRHLDGLRLGFWLVLGIAFVGGLWVLVILPAMADSWFGR